MSRLQLFSLWLFLDIISHFLTRKIVHISKWNWKIIIVRFVSLLSISRFRKQEYFCKFLRLTIKWPWNEWFRSELIDLYKNLATNETISYWEAFNYDNGYLHLQWSPSLNHDLRLHIWPDSLTRLCTLTPTTNYRNDHNKCWKTQSFSVYNYMLHAGTDN